MTLVANKMKSRFLGLWGVVWLLIGCQPQKKYTHLEGQAQGTTFRIVYASEQDFSGAVDSLFRVLDHSMSLWDSTSIISQVNKSTLETPVDIHFETVFRKSQEISSLTDGAFDITVGPLVKAWGFSYKKGLPLPTSQQIDSIKKAVGYRTVQLHESRLVKTNPQTAIDFNAIAQGYTVDVMAHFLKSHAINDFLVEIGGEVRTEGRNEKGQNWQIGIDKPTENQTEERALQTVVSLSGKSLATSGSYRKFVVREGTKFSHAIDPKTGFPITHNLLSISVIADDCMTADAYATAFLVLGLEKAKTMAAQQGLELYAISATSKGELQLFHTPNFFSKAE